VTLQVLLLFCKSFMLLAPLASPWGLVVLWEKKMSCQMFATDANGTGHVLSTKSCLRRLTSVTFLSIPFPVLSLPLQEVKTLCCKHPCFLDYRPALIASKLDLWADVLCVDRSAIARTVMVSWPLGTSHWASCTCGHLCSSCMFGCQYKTWALS
jgi:hypothetical protein